VKLKNLHILDSDYFKNSNYNYFQTQNERGGKILIIAREGQERLDLRKIKHKRFPVGKCY
jgi:hypothetical protein